MQLKNEGTAPQTEGTPDPTARPVPPCGCDTDPVEGLRRMFVDYAQGRANATGRDPASRPVFLRQHGVAHGVFQVRPDLPQELRVGLFGQQAEYPAWVRFSSDVQPGNPDLKGTMGIAIKLFGVQGRKLLEPDQDAPTHDFLLQNFDVFFTDTARDMCEFTCEALNGREQQYLDSHPDTARILQEMRKTVPSTLETPYWSVLPFSFGDARFVKYKLEPLQAPEAGAAPDYDDPSYLRADLRARLLQGDAAFRFLVQFQTSEAEMPLDRATVRWEEALSPPVHVATLVLPRQDVQARGQDDYGENLAFNIWRALAEHAPQGSLAQARKVAYKASAENRRNINGIALGEPQQPRPAQYALGGEYPAAVDRRIVRAAIHPAIGVARVGNSAEFFVGPQVTDPAPAAPGFYRDAQGALKRQAAEFRIYGYDAAGEVVREITADWALVRWSAHLANKKAAWYCWDIALDQAVPEAVNAQLPRRNPGVTDPAARAALVIDGGHQSIQGRNAAGVAFSGTFMGVPVTLGELRTDADGRLHVLPGFGISASPTHAPVYAPEGNPYAFGNPSQWHDDVADGPVSATVEIDGQSIPVEPAWVVTAPPNYAPQLKAVRTVYDLLFDLYVRSGWLPAPATVSFRGDIYPLLQRLSALQWVNQGFAAMYGCGGRFDFDDPAFAERLSRLPQGQGYDAGAELRRQVFNSFRPPQPVDGNQLPWPWLYGDAMTSVASDIPGQNASITQTQYTLLRRWAEGDFVDDWASASAPAATLDEVPLAAQPAMLDRAALDFCLADAFHPGCEVTWPVRHLTMYEKPFRILRRPEGSPEPDYGAKLTQAKALSIGGPVYAQAPGDLTRWMVLPWQGDAAWCRSGYDPDYDPFVPSFWPARVPNQVLSSVDYAIVTDPDQPAQRRQRAFEERTAWHGPLGDDGSGAMMNMVRLYGSMGLVEVREGVAGDPALPRTMQVASYGPDITPQPVPQEQAPLKLAAAVAAAPGEPAQPQPQPRGASFGSREAALRAPSPVRQSRNQR